MRANLETDEDAKNIYWAMTLQKITEYNKEYTFIFQDLLRPEIVKRMQKKDDKGYNYLEWHAVSEIDYPKIPKYTPFIIDFSEVMWRQAYNEFKFTHNTQWKQFKDYTNNKINARVTFYRKNKKSIELRGIEVVSIDDEAPTKKTQYI